MVFWWERSSTPSKSASQNARHASKHVLAGAGQLEVARGWLYKWNHKATRGFWEWRLFILQDSGHLTYFKEQSGGTLQKRGLVCPFPFSYNVWIHSPYDRLPCSNGREGREGEFV